MAVVVDSTVWIDFLNGMHNRQVTLLGSLIPQGQVVLGDLILCEVLQGINDPREFETTRDHLRAFPVYALVGPNIALKSAENYRWLRRRGFTMHKTIDCLIATFCMERMFSLLHRDRDFDPFEKTLGLNCL